MKRKEVNMLSGSIVKGLLTIAIPIMVMNIIQSLFNIIDMSILKTYDAGDGIAVGAVGVCSTLITLITSLVIGVSTGANVVIAKNIGRRDKDALDRSIGSAMAFSITAGMGLALIGVCFAKLFLHWTNCPAELLIQATIYFRLYFLGIPILMVYYFCSSILQASGDSRRPMIFMTLVGALKLVFSYVLIAKFQMGVKGVAIATIISWSFLAFLGLFVLIRSKTTVKIDVANIRFYKTETNQMLYIGIPAGLQSALYSVANVIITATVNTFGTEATTGISIANIYDGILYQISTATAIAVMPYVSQNMGSGNIKRAVKSVWIGIGITVCLGGFFGALSALSATQLSSFLSADPLVIEYARQKMVIISSTYFIYGISEILGAALRGMGKPIPATVTALLYMCVFRFVWVYLIFPLMPTLTFLYSVWPISWILSIGTLTPILFSAVKKFALMCGIVTAS